MKPKKPTLEDQLAFISAQQNVYPTELFQALVRAKKKGTAKAGDLRVEYRGSVGNQIIFLITKSSSVVAQFRVPETFLSEKDVSFDNWTETSRVKREIAKRTPAPSHLKIEDLRVGMKKVNLIAEVIQTETPAKVHTQFRTDAVVSNAVIADETGKILLCLWDQQINSVAVGDCIEVRNAHVAMFKNEKQMRLGKKGSVVVLEKTEAA
jgi:hypothetical protein